MLSPSDGETKYERKKSQPSHVRTQFSPNFVRLFVSPLIKQASVVFIPAIKDKRAVSQVIQGGQQR